MTHPWQDDYMLKISDDVLEIFNNKSKKKIFKIKTTKVKVIVEKSVRFPWCLIGDGIKVHLQQDEMEIISGFISTAALTKLLVQNTPGKRSLETTSTPRGSVDRSVPHGTSDNSSVSGNKVNSVEVKSVKKTLMSVQTSDHSATRIAPQSTAEKHIAPNQKLITGFTSHNSPAINISKTNGTYSLETTVVKPEKRSSASLTTGSLQRMVSTSSSSSHNSQRRGPSSKIVRNDSYNHNNKVNYFTPLSRQLSSTPGHITHEGFKNLGNTCFMNAVIQAFLSVEPFINAITSPLWDTLVTSIDRRKDSILVQLVDTIHRSKQKAHGPMDTSSLKLAINHSDTFSISGRQEDAHEFLGFFLDKIQDEMLHCLKTSYRGYSRISSTTPVEKVTLPVQVAAMMPTYQFFHSEVTEWLTCNHCLVAKEPKEELFRHYEIALLPSQRTMRLEDLLQHYFNSAEEREVRCDECKCDRTFSSKQKISVLPNVLVIGLKRFCADASHQRFDKDCRSVKIPNLLDIEKFCATESGVTEAPVVMSVEEHLSGVTFPELMSNILISEDEITNTNTPREKKQNVNKVSQWKCRTCTALNEDNSEICDACECTRSFTTNTVFDDCGRIIGASPTSHNAPQSMSNAHYQYTLTAVVRHLGSTPYGGHYICDIAKNKEGNIIWKRCNDVKIETVTLDDVVQDSSEPYILFYARDEKTFAHNI